MNAAARPWIGLVFKCLAVLNLIFAFVFFMRMQEEQSIIERYRAEGTVSQAEVVGKQVDNVRVEMRRGRSRTEDWEMLTVRYAKDSPVRYADYAAQENVADLPAPPAASGDPVVDSESQTIIFVQPDVYNAVAVGDRLVVVDTIYSGDDPLFLDEVRDFDPADYYPGMGITLALMLLFGVIGWRIGRRRPPAPAAASSFGRASAS